MIYSTLAVLDTKSYHYANTPMQYKVIFHGCKNDDFSGGGGGGGGGLGWVGGLGGSGWM